MDRIRRHTKRVLTDVAGYLLLVAALLTGWLPGPGGIPLALAGLGLLSIHNVWAKRLRQTLFAHSGRIISRIIIDNIWLQRLYDALVIVLAATAGMLLWQHGDHWQVVSAGIGLIGLALGLSLANRKRFERLKLRIKR